MVLTGLIVGVVVWAAVVPRVVVAVVGLGMVVAAIVLGIPAAIRPGRATLGLGAPPLQLAHEVVEEIAHRDESRRPGKSGSRSGANS
jgi:hypothetical protein